MHLPSAAWLSAEYAGLHARAPFRAAILHTNAGPSANGSLWGWWRQTALSGSHVGAHYQVTFDGRAECYVDPSLVVYHAYTASEWAFGIETQDDDDPNRPWTVAQIATIAAILRYHNVPPRRLTSTTPANGVGFHREFAEWNGSGHYCPGTVREDQIPQVLALLDNPVKPPPVSLGEDVLTILCAPGKTKPRILGDDGQVGAVLGQASWSAFNALAMAGGAKICVMDNQAHYDAIVTQGGGS